MGSSVGDCEWGEIEVDGQVQKFDEKDGVRLD